MIEIIFFVYKRHHFNINPLAFFQRCHTDLQVKPSFIGCEVVSGKIYFVAILTKTKWPVIIFCIQPVTKFFQFVQCSVVSTAHTIYKYDIIVVTCLRGIIIIGFDRCVIASGRIAGHRINRIKISGIPYPVNIGEWQTIPSKFPF